MLMDTGKFRSFLVSLLAPVAVVVGLIFFLRPPAPPPASPGRSAVDIDRLFDDVVEKHRAAFSKGPGCMSGGRSEEIWQLYLKGRLLTMAYPNVMEGILLARAGDPSQSPYTRVLAIDLLGNLCRSGWTGPEVVLHQLAASPELSISQAAIRELSAIDKNGRFLDFYRDRCRKVRSAFDAVSYWYDPATVVGMNLVVGASPGEDASEFRLAAREVLVRQGILASPECGETLLRILEGRGESHRLEWALKVARMKSLPGLLPALRRRLDRAQETLSPNASEAERHDYDLMVRDGFNLERDVAEGRVLSLDHDFDLALIAFAELGGTLTAPERKRLIKFGFLGDPRTRLEELLGEK